MGCSYVFYIVGIVRFGRWRCFSALMGKGFVRRTSDGEHIGTAGDPQRHIQDMDCRRSQGTTRRDSFYGVWGIPRNFRKIGPGADIYRLADGTRGHYLAQRVRLPHMAHIGAHLDLTFGVCGRAEHAIRLWHVHGKGFFAQDMRTGFQCCDADFAMGIGHRADAEQIDFCGSKELAIICRCLSLGEFLCRIGKAFCIEVTETSDFYNAL